MTDVAVRDLNGDAYPDIVTSNYYPPTAGVLLNRQNGTFDTGATYASAARQYSDEVAIGDVNNDGAPDILLAYAADNRVAVFVNHQDGTFNSWATYPIGDVKCSPESAALGDFNNDGYLDIVTANSLNNTVGVLLNQGNGTFAAASFYSIGDKSFPVKVVVADLNQDGYPYILVDNNYFDYTSVLFSRPSGTFAAITSVLPEPKAAEGFRLVPKPCPPPHYGTATHCRRW